MAAFLFLEKKFDHQEQTHDEVMMIYAALAYYFANREQVDRSIEESEAFAEQLRRQTPSLLDQKSHGSA